MTEDYERSAFFAVTTQCDAPVRGCAVCGRDTDPIRDEQGWAIRVIVDNGHHQTVAICNPRCLTEWAATKGRSITSVHHALGGES